MRYDRYIKGDSTRGATIRVTGIGPIHRALAPLLEPELTARIDKANKQAANSLAKKVRAEARPASSHMARAVRVKRARTGRPGWVVGSKRKIAFFFHMVILGTKDHGPRKADALVFVPGWNPYLGASSKGGVGNKWVRAERVRGVRANPIIDRVMDRAEGEVAKRIETDILRGTGL